MLSTKFVHQERTPFLVAPLISFAIRDKSSFHELTEHKDAMFIAIKKHLDLSDFDSLDKIMNYALNEIGLHGTHIYITDLEKAELVSQGHDICLHKTRSQTEPSASELVL